MTILDGFKLSCNAFPSLKNSLKSNIIIIKFILHCFSMSIGKVDLITIDHLD